MTVKITLDADGPNSGRWMHAGYILTGHSSTVESVKELFRHDRGFFNNILARLEDLKAHNATYAYLYQHGPVYPRKGRPDTSFDLKFPTQEDALLFKLRYEP